MPNLPQASAPIEARVAAYDALSASSDQSFWVGNTVHRGRSIQDLSPSEARPWLSASPEAAELLDERVTLETVGVTGIVLGVIGYLAAFVDIPFSTASPGSVPTVPTVALGLGSLVMLAGAVVMGIAETRAPRAVIAYNHWLWSQLQLPVGSAPAMDEILGTTRLPMPMAPNVAAPW